MGAGVTRQCECTGSWGGEATGKDPTNRGKLGTKRHLVVDRHGLPLAATVSASNVHDSKVLEVAADAIPTHRLGVLCHPAATTRRAIRALSRPGSRDTPIFCMARARQRLLRRKQR